MDRRETLEGVRSRLRLDGAFNERKSSCVPESLTSSSCIHALNNDGASFIWHY